MKCIICQKEIDERKSHNAMPYAKGRCCEDCNIKSVIPFRLFLSQEGSSNKQYAIVRNDGIEYSDVCSLDSYQKAVGGYIEIYPKKDEKFIFLCNEEGLLKELEFNRRALEIFSIYVLGPLLVVPKEVFK